MKIACKLLITSLIAATLALPNVAAAQCNPGSIGIHYLDLKLPFPFNGTGGATTLLALTPSTNAGCLDRSEALLKITIPAGCSQANIWVEYEGTPTGWTINVGDSPGNNGFGGDSSEPDSEAELQILDETLSVYSSALGPGIADLLAQDHLALTDGALEIVVRNQYVSWGQPFSALDTTSSQLLFRLPDPPATEPNAFYLGVNRVVSGPGDRTGCGVRRVLVGFS